MTQKRGLGRGLGALIPGAGSTPAPEQELRTRTRPASESGSRSRPVDMFFSGEQVSTEAERAQESRPAPYDLADGMARAAAERRGRTAGGANGRSAARTSSPESAPAEDEATSATAPAKRTTSRSSAARSTASKSTPAKSTAAKSTATKSTSSKGAPAKKAASKSASKPAPSVATSAEPVSTEPASTEPAPPKSRAAKSSAAASTSSASSLKKTPSAKATSAKSTPEAPTSTESAELTSESDAKASALETDAATAPAPETPQVADAVEASSADDGALEDSPVVDIEAVTPTPARSEPVVPAPSTPAVADAAPKAAAEPATGSAEAIPSAPDTASSSTGAVDSASRGLVAVPGAEFAELPIHEVRENPRNPRTMFEDDELDELAYSLREVGVLQPVVVRPIPVTADGESFELVMGERRWRAARRAGLESIPAIIRETSDDDLLRDALLENLHRAQLNPLEEANAYQQLLEDFGCTQDELGERIGRSRPQITNTLRLLRLPALVQRRLASGALSAGHARALLSLDEPALMEELAQRIVAEGLSVRAVERLVARGGQQQTGTRAVRRSTYDPVVVDLTSRLSNRLEAPVRIDVGKRKGRITLEFTNVEDLERLVENMGLDLPAPNAENNDGA